MFQYLHWPKDWGTEIALQLSRAQYQVLFVVDGNNFDKIEAELFRFQNRGGHIELIACLYAWEKNIRSVNALKRLANGGATIGLISLSEMTTPPANSVVIDKSRLISEVALAEAENPGEIIFSQERIWKQLFDRAEHFQPSETEVQLHFQVQPSHVEPGGLVKLYWEVRDADFAEIEPGIGAVPMVGQLEVPVFEDTLFRLKGSNKSLLRTKSVFIKTAQQNNIVLSVFVFDVVSKAYIPLESTKEQGHVYAIFVGDRIRIDWNSLPIGVLSEAKLGDIPNESSINLEVFSDESFKFKLRTIQEDFIETLQILAISDEKIDRPLKTVNHDQSIETTVLNKKNQEHKHDASTSFFQKIVNLLRIWK